MAVPQLNLRRNYVLGILNGTFFMAALAFVAGSTVLPVFISKLTSSRILIGIISHIEWFGWMFPQLFSAAFLVHRKRSLGFYNGLSIIRLTIFAAVIGSIFIFHDSYGAILLAFGIGFTLFSLSSGLAGVAFMEVVGKSIPLERRGSFFGWRMFSGGLLAALAGLVVRKIMASYRFPFDFGYTCVMAWVLMFFGLVSFALLREPENIDPLEKAAPGKHLLTGWRIFKSDHNLRRMIYSKAWINSALMAMPFYVIFSIEFLGAAEWMAGIYLTVQMIGYLASNLLWGWLSNRVSNRLVILLSSFFRLVPPLMAFAAFYITIDPYVFSTVFLILGMGEAGIDMGYMNYLLEIAPDRGRPLYIGLAHTLIAPTILFSGLGGWLGELLTLKWLFATVFVTAGVALVISLRLREPRYPAA